MAYLTVLAFISTLITVQSQTPCSGQNPTELPQLIFLRVNETRTPPEPVVSLKFKTDYRIYNTIWWVSREGEWNDLVITEQATERTTERTKGQIYSVTDRTNDNYEPALYSNVTLSSARVSIVFIDDCSTVIRNILFQLPNWYENVENAPSRVVASPRNDDVITAGRNLSIHFAIDTEYFTRFYIRLVTYRGQSGIEGPTREHSNPFYSNFVQNRVPFEINSPATTTTNETVRELDASVEIPTGLYDFSLDFIALKTGYWGAPIDNDWMNYVVNYHSARTVRATHMIHPCYRGLTRVRRRGRKQVVEVTDGFSVCFYVQVNGNPLPEFALHRIENGRVGREWVGTEPSPPTATTAIKLYFSEVLATTDVLHLSLTVGDIYQQRIVVKTMSRTQIVDLTQS